MSAAFTLTLTDKPVRDALAALREAGADLTPLLHDFGTYGETSSAERFETGIDPQGVAWKPSHRAQTEGGQTLVESAQLRDSLTSHVEGPEAVEWGSNKIYARVHQDGATIHAKDGGTLRFTMGQRTVFAKQVVIPRRAYLGLSAADIEHLTAIAGDHLARVTAGGGE